MLIFVGALVYLIMLIFLCSTVSLAIQQRYRRQTGSTGRGTDNDTQEEYNKDGPANPLVAAIETYRRQRNAHERQRAQREQTTIIVLGSTAIFALLALGASAGTIYLTHSDTLVALAKTDTSISETRRLAEQAKRQADTADKALTAVQRAFITVSDLRVTVLTDPTGKKIWHYAPAIENSGSTPTTQMSMIAITPRTENTVITSIIEDSVWSKHDMNVASDPVAAMNNLANRFNTVGPSDPLDIFDWSPEKRSSISVVNSMVIGPRTTIYPQAASYDVTLTDFCIIQNADGSTSIGASNCRVRLGPLFYGAIKYVDIFNVSHVTLYCFNIGTFERGSAGESLAYTWCPHWNCTDRGCDSDRESYLSDVARTEKAARERNEWIEKMKRQQ